MKILFLLLFLASCGSENNKKNQTPTNKDKNQPSANPRLGEERMSGWQGMVTKCLIEVTGKDKRLQQKIVCSETLQGESFEDVSSKLGKWKKVNCPDVLDIRGEAQDWGYRRWKAERPQSVISNMTDFINEKKIEDGVCVNTGWNFNYGFFEPIQVN